MLKNRASDIECCGCDKENIKKSKPILDKNVLKYYHLYLKERHEIYKKKELLQISAPWTKDEVFRNYRFTNTRRELDKESKWLIENISESTTLSMEEKISWSILFRTYNKSETFRVLGFPNTLSILDIDGDIIENIRSFVDKYSVENPKYVWFTPAFNTGGLKYANAFPNKIKENAYLNQPKLSVNVIYPDGTLKEMSYKEARDLVNENTEILIEGWEPCIPLRMIHMIRNLSSTNFINDLLQCNTQQQIFNKLLEVHGLSDFLAYQIFVDFTYIPEFPFSENEFTVAGPGCKRGIDNLFKDKDGMSYEECCFWIRDNIENEFNKNGLEYDVKELYDHLPEHDRCLNVMMIENSFCELSKLVKAKTDRGRPRQKYKAIMKEKETEGLF